MKKSKIVKLSLNKKVVSNFEQNALKGGTGHTCPQVTCNTCTTALFTNCDGKHCY